jgi:hypothetical protein
VKTLHGYLLFNSRGLPIGATWSTSRERCLELGRLHSGGLRHDDPRLDWTLRAVSIGDRSDSIPDPDAKPAVAPAGVISGSGGPVERVARRPESSLPEGA